MNHNDPGADPAELVALYAAGALPAKERAALEAHLDAGCAVCAEELQRLHSALVALAAAVESVPPEPEIRQALLRRLVANPEPLSGAPPQPGPQQAEAAGELVIRRASEGSWEPLAVDGVLVRVLFLDRANNRLTALVRMAPGMSYPRHVHSGPEECFLLEGDLRVGEEILHKGDYQRAPAGSTHGVQSTENGCLLLIASSLADKFV